MIFLRHYFFILFFTGSLLSTLSGQESASEPSRFKVILSSGKSYVGEIIVQDDKGIVLLREESGIEYRIPQDQIKEIRQVSLNKNYVSLYRQKGIYGSVSLGLGFNQNRSLFFTDASMGYQFSPRALIGAGAGLYYFQNGFSEQVRTPFLEWRSIWSEHRWAPITTLRGGVGFGSYRRDDFGFGFGWIDRDYDPGLMMQVLVGVRLTTSSRKDFLLEAGYTRQQLNYTAFQFDGFNNQFTEISHVKQTYQRWIVRCTLIL